MESETTQVALTPVGGMSSGNARSGFDEQWQRHLEKAYFDKQVELMKGTNSVASSEKPTVQPISNTPVLEKETIQSEMFSSSLQFGSQVGGHQSVISTKPQLEGVSVANTAKGVAQDSLTGGVQGRSAERVSTRAPAVAPVLSGVVTPSFKGVLPEDASVTTVSLEGGIHLVIRDASLSQGQLLAVITQLRELVEASHQRLVAVSLNGEIVWETESNVDREVSSDTSRSLSGLESPHSDNLIDKLF